jgi:sulfoxide reductase heme-binding subunit YedZ
MTSAIWAVGRGTGVMALVLFSLTMVLGLVTRRGAALPGLPRFASLVLHRNASLLGVVFLAGHVVSMVVDPYAGVSLVATVVPLTASYRPLWVGLGALALDVLAAVLVTSLLRGRIPARAWRAVHWLAYALWPLAVVHTFGSGTDAWAPWLLAVQVPCIAAVAAAGVWRVATARPAPLSLSLSSSRWSA